MGAAEFPWVRLVRNQSNTLYAPAVNQGAALCERPWLLLLNPDCEVTPETLLPLVQFLAENSEYGAAAPLLTDGTGQAAPGIMEAPGFWTPLFFGTPLERWLPNSRELKRWFCLGTDCPKNSKENPTASKHVTTCKHDTTCVTSTARSTCAGRRSAVNDSRIF